MAAVKRNISLLDILHQIGMDEDTDFLREGAQLLTQRLIELVALLLLFGKNLIRMFTTTEEIINLGVRQIRILAPGYVAMAISQIYGGIMRGAGDTMPSMWISMFTVVVIRVPLAYLLAWLTRSQTYPAGSPDALFFSLVISWIMGAIANYLWYRRGTWREKSLVPHEQVE
jgi:Na+-driven multidrug efflux pump